MDPNPEKRFRLSNLFIGFIISVSTSIAIVVTGLQLFSDYRRDVSQLELSMSRLEDSYSEVLAKIIWDVNDEYLSTVADSILRQPHFKNIEIIDDKGEVIYSRGEKTTEGSVEKILPLYIGEAQGTHLGDVFIRADLTGIYAILFDRLLLIFLSNFVKTLLVTILFYLFMKKYLITPLVNIATYLQKMPEATDLEPFELRNHRYLGKSKELSVVESNINSMGALLNQRLKTIQNNNETLEQKVNQQNKRIKENYEWKSALLRVVCHDIAQPLTMIETMADFLHSGGENLDVEQKQIVANLVKASDIGSKIVRQIRDLEAIGSSKKKLKLSNTSLAIVIENLKFLFKDRLRAKDINLEIEMVGQVTVKADPLALQQQVFANILSNAIKFSPRHSTIKFQVTTTPGERVLIRIKDQGIGMPAEILDNVFSPVAVTSRRGTDGEEGTGFGMPLVKAFLEHMGATINVSSSTIESDPQDHGTTVTIEMLGEQEDTLVSAS